MIRTVADLLHGIRERELAAISRTRPVGHGGMIGDMYEGLTRHLLDRMLFEGADLRVVEGKLRDSGGALSAQLDCMIVVGDGERMPHTNHYIYHIAQVVAVVEVKKNLYGIELNDALANLSSVAARGEAQSMPRRLSVNPFRAVAAVDLTTDDEILLHSPTKQLIFQAITTDAVLPVRIVLGYAGYASENTLRNGFLRQIEALKFEDDRSRLYRYSPFGLPNLVMVGNAALVKLNGMPYAARSNHDEWCLMGSTGTHAVLILLELIWTRLVSHHGLNPDVFGDDLEIETINPLLFATAAVVDQEWHGWNYEPCTISPKQLRDAPVTSAWTPAVCDEVQFVALSILCKKESIAIDNDAELTAYLASKALSKESFVDRMLSTGLVYLTPARVLRLLTEECVCAIDPEIGFIAAENRDGRVTRWLNRRIDQRGEAASQ